MLAPDGARVVFDTCKRAVGKTFSPWPRQLEKPSKSISDSPAIWLYCASATDLGLETDKELFNDIELIEVVKHMPLERYALVTEYAVMMIGDGVDEDLLAQSASRTVGTKMVTDISPHLSHTNTGRARAVPAGSSSG